MASKLSLFLAELKRRKVYFVGIVLVLGCGDPAPLTVEVPLHLEEHLDAATIIGSELPEDVSQPVEWRFTEPQPGWAATTPRPIPPEIQPAGVSQKDDALRITLGPANARPDGRPRGGAYIDVPEWDHRDWAHIVIRARSSGPGNISLGFNLWDQEGHPGERWSYPYEVEGRQGAPLVGDSTVQTYQLPFEPEGALEGPIEQLGLWFGSPEPLTVDILSITVVPMDAVFADEDAGTRHLERDGLYRRSLFVHTPAQIEYPVLVPEGGRFDTGLGTLWSEPPTTFRVTVRDESGQAETLLEESHGDEGIWAQSSIDLSAYAGKIVILSLEAESEREGSVAFWGAPTLTGSRTTERPNVIFYIIDGAGPEYMSLYGYNRHTTPNIDRLAAEGAVFEWAYSNSSWTRPSTASFMTSLQHSVLGGAKGGFNVVPDNVLTMAQHFHQAGYQTAVFTPNPNAGKMSGLEREVDNFQEDWDEFLYTQSGHWRESSRDLHGAFWNWREAFPGEPYWVHFQTIDIHGDFPAVAPFGGLYVGPEEVKSWEEAGERLRRSSGGNTYTGLYEDAGVDRVWYNTVEKGLYDEALAYNDYQLGRLVERLKVEGEWENTLLVIGADHGPQAVAGDLRLFVQDSLPAAWAWNSPYFRPGITRVPLLFVWPGHIEAGQRFSEPVVSMIDALPTILDLVGLPLPEVMRIGLGAWLGAEDRSPLPRSLDHSTR